MAGTSRFSEVPVVDVNATNIKEVWSSLVLAVKTATYVAMDTELSGLGDRKLLVAKSLPDRYKNLCQVARTHSVVSLGLSCFKLEGVHQTAVNKITHEAHLDSAAMNASGERLGHMQQWTYSVQTFNVMLLCSEDFMVEPAALKFLVEHGFDFNKQYSSGVSYFRGKEKTDSESSKAAKTAGPSARQLFDILLWSEAPIVFHNGFVDLVFLYQNLYTDLPSNLQMFLADLAEMFPEGVLDTKYLVEFVDRLPASYLEYVFRKWQRRNALQSCMEKREVCVEFPHSAVNPSYVSCSHCDLPTTCVEMDYIPKASVLQNVVCQCFAGHGWCSKGKQCPKSHAIDLILDLDGIKTAKNRKRRRKLQEQQKKRGTNNGHADAGDDDSHDETYANDDNELVNSEKQDNAAAAIDGTDTVTDDYLKSSFQLEKSRSGGHRAGFDAFMTGFIMACLLSKHTSADESEGCVFGAGIKLKQLKGVDHLRNKVYATGKDQPLIVAKSNFASTSKSHKDRLERVRKTKT